MSPAFWLEALKQVPALAVVAVAMVLVVRWFLRALREVSQDGKGVVNHFLTFMDDRDSRLQKEFAARVSEIRTMQAEQAASRLRGNDLFNSLLHSAFQGEL